MMRTEPIDIVVGAGQKGLKLKNHLDTFWTLLDFEVENNGF